MFVSFIFYQLRIIIIIGLTFVYWCIRHIIYTYIGGFLFGYLIILSKPFTFKLNFNSMKDNLINFIMLSYFIIIILNLFQVCFV